MKFATQKIYAAFFLVLSFLWIVPPVNSTTLVRMSVTQMTRAAQLVVRARCLASSTAWDGGEIWTFSSFTVEENWKTSAVANSSSYLTVRLLGGTVGNLTSTVSGVPRFIPGEEVILFLQPSVRGSFAVVSWMQGTFRVRRDLRTGQELAEQDTASFETYDPGTHSFRSAGLRHLPVENLRALVDAGLCANSTCAQGKK